MNAIVLEPNLAVTRRDIEVHETLGPDDVRISPKRVGICGSDVHYCLHGRIGPFVVKKPMVLGHEAAGVVLEVGEAVQHLKVGDRVCMEPGVPQAFDRASRQGLYNLEPSVRFWATPPVHGVLRETVVHPAAFTYRLPDNVSFGEGAMVEPLAVGMHAVTKARVKPGDFAVVLGAGPIGILTAVSALAAGCSRVMITDVLDSKLAMAEVFQGISTVNVSRDDAVAEVRKATLGWGADVVFEASGANDVAESALEMVAPGGSLVLIGMPTGPMRFDTVAAQAKEVTTLTVFRYVNVFPRTLDLIASGKLPVSSLITDVFPYEEGVEAFRYAMSMPATSLKIQIGFPD